MDKRKVITTLVFALVVALVSLFVWRMLSFYQKIQSGTLEPGDLSFQSRLTTSTLAQSLAMQTEGLAHVDTTDDPAMGAEDAPLTIVEFADFGCPYSQSVSYTIRRLASLYPKQVRYVYRDFPLVDLHPDAERAAEAAACAHDQHAFWAYHDKLYQNQDDFSEAALAEYALEVGLDVEEFEECLDEQLFVAEVADDMAAGLEAGVVGTPTFFFNGTKVEGAIPEDIFESLVNALLESSST